MPTPSTKEKILNAAIHLLETSGIKGLTQPAVAKLVGIPQGQLTYHFRKRSDLILAVSQSAMDRVAEYVWAHHPELASRSFGKFVELTLELMKSKTRVRALLGLVIEADENPEVSRQLIEQALGVRTLIATAVREEEDSAEVTVAHATMLGFALMFFIQNDKQKRSDLEKHFHVAVKMVEKHLREKKGGK